MLEVLLIRPGSTTFDAEGRIKGSLDIPLSRVGETQAEELSKSLAGVKLDCLYVAPSESALKSAEQIAERNFCKQKVLECLRNLDHGLWQGKLVSEVRRLQPKVYRQFQEHPRDVCPPQGETVQAALDRIKVMVEKLKKRHNGGRIGLIVPQPMASIVRFALVGGTIGDLWQSELDFGTFETIPVEPSVAVSRFSILATA
ncbi:MAG: histidine phosphatase family protein [Planctomycetales bacterium]|nr:histidine phosphatase family protein [Planctomycetales bacterium]